MFHFKVRIAQLVGLCIVSIGVASNLLYFIDKSGYSYTPRYTLVALIMLWIGIFMFTKILSRNRSSSFSLLRKGISFWVIGLLGLQALALLRTVLTEKTLMIPGIFSFVLLVLYFSIFLRASLYLKSTGREADYWKYLAWSVIILCIVSIFLRIIGITGNLTEDQTTPSITLSLLGININRVSMPLFSGLNSAGLIFGIGFVCAIIFIKAAGISFKSVFLLAMALILLFVFLWIDTRGSMIAAFVAILFTLKSMRIRVAIIVSSVTLIVAALLAGLFADGSSISRTGYGFTTSRDIIWGLGLIELFDPKVIHIVGYGAWGQYISGISSGFSDVFSEETFELATLHNAFLQTLFDSGYIGLIFYIICWTGLIRSACRQQVFEKSEAIQLKLGFAIYVVIAGTVEAFVGYATHASMFLYVGILVGFLTDPLKHMHKIEFYKQNKDFKTDVAYAKEASTQ
jgi:hypothetical protein